MLKYTYIDERPTGRPSFTVRSVGCSLRAAWAGVANSQTDRHRAKVTVGAYMWACELPVVVLALNCENHEITCVILAVLTCLPLIKTFCISLSKLRAWSFIYYFHGIGLYRVRISGMFLQFMCLRSIFGVVVPTQPCGL